MHKRSCLCGAVSFEVTGALPPPDACHCTQCRKQSGHFFVSTDVPRAFLTVRGAGHLTWFASSGRVRRGFCSICGDRPTRTRLGLRIFAAEKGDYYDIADGLPQKQH